MKYITTTVFITLSLFIVSTGAMANEPAGATASKPALTLESDWLDTEVGSTGNILGAKVINIESNPGHEITVIKLELQVDNPDDFEKIEVIDKKTLQPIKQKGNVEWLENHEEGTYGLRLHLKKVPGFEFQLRLIDSENDRNINTNNP